MQVLYERQSTDCVLTKDLFTFLCSPTTLDAVVFAHLAVICKAPLPNNKLYNYLQGYDNLCMFCGRVLQRYFPPEPEGMLFSLNLYTVLSFYLFTCLV